MNNYSENSSDNKKKKITDTVISVWLLGSIAASILLGCFGQVGWVVLLIGQILLVIGIIAVRTSGNAVFIVFSVIGVWMILWSFSAMSGFDMMTKFLVRSIPNLFFAFVMYVGISCVRVGWNGGKKKARCTEAVLAKCVDVDWSYVEATRRSEASMTYCPVYEYAYNGRIYTGCEKVYVEEDGIEIGDYREILVNPDNPEEFCEEGRSENVNVVLVCFGLICMGPCIAGIIAYNF